METATESNPESKGMLIWVVALHCEAKPIIDFYRLKKVSTSQPFDRFESVNKSTPMACVISGSGKISVAAATAWAAAIYSYRSRIAWINLGVSGGKGAIGSLFWLYKITDVQANQNYYPVKTFKTKLTGIACNTLNSPGIEYQENCLIDMEASAFFATANRFSSVEFIHSLKVISDNPDYKFPESKATVSDLIANNFDPVNRYAQDLIRLYQDHDKHHITDSTMETWTSRTRFTQNQQLQLITGLRFLLNRKHKNLELLDQTIDMNTKSILAKIRALCHQESLNL